MLTEQEWIEIDKIPGWMGRLECDWLSTLAEGVESWTDVGVYCGRSSTAVALHLPPHALLQLVDIGFQPGFYIQHQFIAQARPDLRIITCQADSKTATSLLLRSTEVVFIDADHTYDSVKQDILLWKDRCSTLCGHDYQPNWVGVVRAVNELCPGSIQPVPDLWVRP